MFGLRLTGASTGSTEPRHPHGQGFAPEYGGCTFVSSSPSDGGSVQSSEAIRRDGSLGLGQLLNAPVNLSNLSDQV